MIILLATIVINASNENDNAINDNDNNDDKDNNKSTYIILLVHWG